MLDSFLISSDIQRKWIEKFKTIEDTFKQRAAKKILTHPFDNIKWLVEEGYSVLTLPKSYGGEGATIEDMVVLIVSWSHRWRATALSIGWHLSVVGTISTAYVESNYA